MASTGDLPLLQDTAAADVWTDWAVTCRDVVVVGADNVRFDVYNLTPNDLNDPANHQPLGDLLRAGLGP